MVAAFEISMSHPDTPIDLQEHTKGTLLKDAPRLLAGDEPRSEAQAQHDIMTRILKSDLIASGIPLGGAKEAFLIPTDLFVMGDVDWKKSTVSRLDQGFSDIRLLPEVRKYVSNRKDKVLADYFADYVLTENEASLLLGISRRALQGYRLKGGGPVFETFGKAHKYKAGDLRAWQSAKRKS